MSSIKPRSYSCSLDILWFDCCSSSTGQNRINSRNGRESCQPRKYSPEAPISCDLLYWQVCSPRILQVIQHRSGSLSFGYVIPTFIFWKSRNVSNLNLNAPLSDHPPHPAHHHPHRPGRPPAPAPPALVPLQIPRLHPMGYRTLLVPRHTPPQTPPTRHRHNRHSHRHSARTKPPDPHRPH